MTETAELPPKSDVGSSEKQRKTDVDGSSATERERQIEGQQSAGPESTVGFLSEIARLRWQPLVFPIWIFGVVVILARFAGRHVVLQRMIQRSLPLTSRALTKQLAVLKDSLKIQRDVRVRICPAVSSPALYGYYRPIILLPEQFHATYSEEEQHHVLLHELAHLKRADSLLNLWTALVQLVHWPNPFVWLAARRIREDRELATDDFVLRTSRSVEPEAYGETILKTLQSLPRGSSLPGLVGIAEARSSLRRRFAQIAGFERSRKYSQVAIVFLMISLFVTCLTQSPGPAVATHILFVRVTDATTGRPLPDVEVISVFEFVVGYKSNETTAERTNDDGVARLEIPNTPGPETRFFLNAIPADNYVSQYRQWEDEAGLWGKLPTNFEFRLRPGESIGGVVTDEQGSPLENIAVQATAYEQALNRESFKDSVSRLYRPFEAGIRTDKNGRWTCDGVPPSAGMFFINFKKPSGAEFQFGTARVFNRRRSYYNGAPILAQELKRHAAKVSLPDGEEIELQVVNQSGARVSDAQVQELTGAVYRKLGAVRLTDKTGQVRFEGRSGDQFGYVISHPEYATTFAVVSVIDGERSAQVTMEPRLGLSGKIVDRDGDAIAGARIDLGTDVNSAFYSDWVDISDHRGRFEWRHAPREAVYYRVRADGFATRVIQLSGSLSPVEIVLEDVDRYRVDHTLRIYNKHTGELIPEFTYMKSGLDFYTFQGGREGTNGTIHERKTLKEFSEKPFRGESHRTLVRAKGFVASLSRLVSKYEYDAEDELELDRIDRRLSLKDVMVLDPEGNPAPGVRVHLVGRDNNPRLGLRLQSAANGKPTILEGVFRASVLADEQGRLAEAAYPIGYRGIAIVDARGTFVRSVDELDLSAETIQMESYGGVAGTLQVDGQLGADIRVGLRVMHNGSKLISGTFYTHTDDQGRFTFAHVPVGDYRLFLAYSSLDHQSGPAYYPLDVAVLPGEVSTVAYRVAGRTLTARLQGNAELEALFESGGHYSLRSTSLDSHSWKRPHHDTFVDPVRLREANWQFQNVTRERLERKMLVYPVVVTEDGYLIATSIPPGSYVLEIDIRKSIHEPRRSMEFQLAQMDVPVVIPQGPADQVIDLGAIEVPSVSIE